MIRGKDLFNIPNILSMIRVLMLFAIVFMVIYGNSQMILYASVLTILMILLDYVDGFAARKYNMSTKLGGTIDIAADRIIENVFWVLLLYIDVIPIWVPIIFITRGFLVDVSRAHVKKAGWSVIHSKLGKIFVGSRASRGISGLSKIAAFVASLLVYYLKVSIANGTLLEYQAMLPSYIGWQLAIVWFAVLFNVLRGILTISDSIKFLEAD